MLQPFTNPRETAQVVTAWQAYPDAEAFFLGASLVQVAFSPEAIRQETTKALGKAVNTFNCGIGRLHSREAEAYLRTLLKRSRPRLIIYGTSIRECTHYPDSASRYYRVFASPADVSRILVYGAESYSDFAESLGALFRPSALLFEWAVTYGFRFGSYLGLPSPIYDQVLEELRQTAGWYAVRRPAGRRPGELEYCYDPSSIAWENLKRLKETADGHKTPLVILLMPVGEPHFTSEATASFAIDLRQFCLDEGIGFFDMNQQPFSPESSDYDSDDVHLLFEGAERFSRRFARFALLESLNHKMPRSGKLLPARGSGEVAVEESTSVQKRIDE